MSLYGNQPGETWTLKSAVDALAGSARRAGRPGWIWVAGFAYPFFLVYGWEIVILLVDPNGDSGIGSGSLPGFIEALKPSNDLDVEEAIALSLFLLVVTMPLFRLAAGLARLTSPGSWAETSNDNGHPTISKVWLAGKGLTLSSCGLQIQVALMFILAIVLCAGPVYFVMEHVGIGGDIAVLIVASPVFLLLVIYGAVLSSLMQLALHSLAQNHRGVASAMLHAWRLLRRDVWMTARTMAVDSILILSIFLLLSALHFVGGESCLVVLVLPAHFALLGFAGVARAGFWALAYRALGGLSPDDGVPGLVEEAA